MSATPSTTPTTPPHATVRLTTCDGDESSRVRVEKQIDPAFFKALADPTRVHVLACLLSQGRACTVTEIASCCSVDFSVVARHLSHLARAGILTSQRRGRCVWYRVRIQEVCSRLRDLAGVIEQAEPDRDDD